MVSEEIRGMIPDYIRGLLSREEAEIVCKALSAYPELAREYEAAKRYYAVLNQLPDTAAPEGFLDEVNRLIDKRPVAAGLINLLFKPFAIKLPLEGAGLAACCIIAILVLQPPSPEKTLPETFQQPMLEMTEHDLPPEDAPQKIAARIKPKPSPTAHKSVELAPGKPSAREQQPEMPSKEAVIPPVVSGTAVQAIPDTESRAEAVSSSAALTRQEEKTEVPEQKTLDKDHPADLATVDIGIIELSYAVSLSSVPLTGSTALRSEKSPTPPAPEGQADPKSEIVSEKEEKSPSKPTSASAPAAQTQRMDQPVSISEMLDPILTKHDSLLTISTKSNIITYTLVITPENLSSLSKELSRTFALKSRLLPFDPLITKRVRVTFSIKE